MKDILFYKPKSVELLKLVPNPFRFRSDYIPLYLASFIFKNDVFL